MNPAVRLLLLGGRWTPLRLFSAGEQGAWFDCSDFSTMFQDSAGTTPVTAAGQPVGKILDKSGRGNHRTQATAASRPTLQQDASGYWYLSYDGVDDFMVTGSVDFSGTNKLALWSGFNSSSTNPQIVTELSVDSSANAGVFSSSFNTSIAGAFVSQLRGSATGGVRTPGNFAAPTSDVLSFQYDLSAATEFLANAIRVNGVVQTATSTNASAPGGGTFGNYPIYFASRGGSGLRLIGREYGTIILGRAATSTEITTAERYIGSKMGIAP